MEAGRQVVVHGATGVQGAPVARALRAAGYRVRVATRRPERASAEGFEPVAAALEDADALAAAYAGAAAVVVVLPGPAAPDDVAVRQADAVLAALARAEVPQAIFNASGAVWGERVGVPFLDARTRLASGLAGAVERATVVAPTTRYMENLDEPWVARGLRDGVLRQPAPPGAAARWLALDDLAALVVSLVGASEPPARLALVGPEALTGDEVAATLGKAVGRPVRWETVSFAEYNLEVAAALGEHYAAGLASLYAPGVDLPAPLAMETTRTGATSLAAWAARRRWEA